jgi:glycosyltransferase involved in cell wall biosynthesis
MLLNRPQTASRLNAGLAAWSFTRRLKTEFDLIEVPDWGAPGLFLALAGRIPLVGYLHRPLALVPRATGTPLDRDEQWADALERYTMRRCDSLTSPSELLVEALNGWLADLPVGIIRAPIDIDAWASNSQSGGEPIVLQVGRVEPMKNPLALVNAIALLARRVPGVRAVFIGRSIGEHNGVPYRLWLQSHAAAIGAPCEFIDEVPRQELRRWYARARVVALPSRFDNFPMVALEAMSAGRPVVVSDQVGVGELLGGTRAGAVVPLGDDDALARALQPYLVDWELAESAGREARHVVAAACAPDQVAERRETFYRVTIERSRSRRQRGKAA